MAFQQKTKLVGKLVSAEVKEFTSKAGKEMVSTKAKIKVLPQNVMMFVDSISVKATMPSFVLAQIEQYNAMAEQLTNGEDVYVGLNIYPSKKGKELIQYNYIYQETIEDGATFLKAKGFVQPLASEIVIDEETGEEDTLVTIKGFKDDYQVSVRNIDDPKIEVTMIVEDYNDEEIFLTNGDDKYPVNLKVENAQSKTPPTIGQGYSFSLTLVKGKKIELEREENLLDFNQTELKNKFIFLPDTFRINAVAICKSYKSDKFSKKDNKNEMGDMLSLMGL